MELASVLNTVQAPPLLGGGQRMPARNRKPNRFARDAKDDDRVKENESRFTSFDSIESDSAPRRIVSLPGDKAVTACASNDSSGLTEDDLVDAARKGDEAAFEQLVDRHKGRIYRRALRIMGNPEDAEDVGQLSFQKAFLHLSEFEGRSSFSTWITRIAINEALMMRRRNRLGREVSIDDAISSKDMPVELEIVDTRPNPEHRYAQVEWREILNSALGALRPAIRLTLLMHGLDELSVQQTAEMLGVTVNATKSRINRGRRALREKIRKHLASAGAAPIRGEIRL